MADIFVSYATEDRDRIRPLVEALQAEGWSVWWDRNLVAGPSFDEKIEEAIDAARCVVVAWSEYSVKSRWCRTEANEGLERQILVPLLIDDVRPPLAFRSSQTASLHGWPHDHGEMDAVLSGIRQCLGVSASAIAEADSEMKSIAVLPFVNMSSDPEQEYFVDGITEDLIDRLSRNSSLRVIARTSSFQFRNSTDDVRDIGTRLGVTHLVEGSVRRIGKKLRITAQLVRTDDGGHVWSAQYDRELDDVFALQDEITQEVTRQLTDRLIEPTAAYQPKAEAYDEYLKGQVWLRRVGFGEARRARSFFDKAAEADPKYAEAYAAAAKASLMEGGFSVTAEDAVEAHKRAVDYIDKALALDSGLASAVVQKAKLVAQWDFDVQAALDLLRNVLANEPNMYEALSAGLTVYLYAGRRDLAEQTARKLIQIDPVGIGNAWLFFLLLGLGRLDEAQEAGEKLLAVEVDNKTAHANMADLMARQGRIEEALAFLQDCGLQNSVQAGFVYAAAGLREELERVVKVMKGSSGLKVWLAHGYALLGDIDGVLRSLKQAIENHDTFLCHLIGHGPYYDCIDIDGNKLESTFEGPAVQEVMRQVNLDRESIGRLRI